MFMYTVSAAACMCAIPYVWTDFGEDDADGTPEPAAQFDVRRAVPRTTICSCTQSAASISISLPFRLSDGVLTSMLANSPSIAGNVACNIVCGTALV